MNIENNLLDCIVTPGTQTDNAILVPQGAKVYIEQFGSNTNAMYTKKEIKIEEKLPFGNTNEINNIVQSNIDKEFKILGVGYGLTEVKKYKYTYYLTASFPVMPHSINLQIVFQFEIEGRLLEVKCLISDVPSKRITDIKAPSDIEKLLESRKIDDDKLLQMIMDEKLDSNYPDDAVCIFRKAFRYIVSNN